MKIVERNTDGEIVPVKEAKKICIADKDGNVYRITDDIEHGLEIIAEDGRIHIEPHTSNHITILTI